MKKTNTHNLKLYTGEETESFLEGLVDEFLHISLSKNRTLAPEETELIQKHFDNFISFCVATSSGKIVLDNGKMTPFVNPR
jgi:hypothetical protein